MTVVFRSYANGLSGIWQEKRLLFFVYTVNLFFAYLLTLPVTMMLSRALAETTAADRLLKSFDYTLYTNIIRYFGQGVDLPLLILPFGLFYFILNIFLAGGIIDLFVNMRRFDLSAFVHACLTYFVRFLRLFGISLLFILVIVVMNVLLTKLFGLFAKHASTERIPFIFFFVRILIIFVMLICINMLFDYAKIITIKNDSARVFEAFKMSLQFVRKRFIQSISLYKLYFLTALLILLAYWCMQSFMGISRPWMVLVFFLWTQIIILMKIWIRLSFFAGQTTFYFAAVSAELSKLLPDDPLDESVKQP